MSKHQNISTRGKWNNIQNLAIIVLSCFNHILPINSHRLHHCKPEAGTALEYICADALDDHAVDGHHPQPHLQQHILSQDDG